VYAIEEGRVSVSGDQSIAIVGSDKMLDYWHLDYTGVVKNGDHVAQHQLIGHIAATWGHVHLAESHRAPDGKVYYVNPLRPGAISPYEDHGPPVVNDLSVSKQTLSNLSGTVDMKINTYDKPPIALPPASSGYPSPQHPQDWTGAILSPTKVSWEVSDSGGNTVMGARVAVDFSQYLCSADIFDQIYASGTIQNGSGAPGNYNFYLVRNWDTTKLKNGQYTVSVASTDNRNNITVKKFSVNINNLR
jgi:hypothetical protein